MIVGVLLFVVALIAGMQVDGGGVDLFGLIVLALLVNLTAAMWAAGVAMRLRTIQAGPLMQMPVFIILFLAPVYVPLALLAGWVQRGRERQPVHGADRGRPRPDLGRHGRRRARLRHRDRARARRSSRGRCAGCGAPSAPDSRCRRLGREARAPPQRPGPVRDRRGGNGARPDARRRRSSRIAVVRAAPRDRSYSSKGAVNGCMCSPASAAPCIENSGRPRLRLSHATQGYRPVDHG